MDLQGSNTFYRACIAGISERDMYLRVRGDLYTPDSFANALSNIVTNDSGARVSNATDVMGDYFYVRTVGEPTTRQFEFLQKAAGIIPGINQSARKSGSCGVC
jgi:hypothetical protein